MDFIQVDKLLLVEVREDAFGFEINKRNQLGYWTNSGLHEKWNEIDLPSGSYEIIGTTDSMTEEICDKIIDIIPASYSPWVGTYPAASFDYEKGEALSGMSAPESFASLLRKHNISTDKRYLIIKKIV